MQRITIIGNYCSGKSTLAEQLGKKLQLQVHHLDFLLWKPEWEKNPEPIFNEYQRKLFSYDKWIMEGIGYWSSIIERTEQADTIIFLDQPVEICKIRALNRVKESMIEPDPYITINCSYYDQWQSQLASIEDFDTSFKPQLLKMLAGLEDKNKIHIEEASDTNDWIRQILKK